MRIHLLSRSLVTAVVLVFCATLPVATVSGFLPPPQGPIANAGPPQFVLNGSTVVLDGTLSTSGTGAPLSYQWAFVSVPPGSAPTLSDATAVNPTFVVPQDGSYVLSLTVSDGTSSSSAQVVVSTQSTPPVADAGVNQAVAPGALVQLNGSGSFDPEGDSLTFQWLLTSRPTGSLASISNPSAIAPTFLADVAGTYVAQLTVTDSHGKSSSDSVTVSTGDLPPIARAGNRQRVTTGTTVQLNAGGSSDPDGDPLTYKWSFLARPSASTANLSATNIATPTFVADAPGAYVVQVAVTDSHANISLATVGITTDAIPPTANAGSPQAVSVGATVQVNGSASSDPGGAPLLYLWTLLSKPSGSTATLPPGPSSVTRSFVADRAGEYLVQLVVLNSLYASSPSTVLITAAPSGGRLILSPNPLAFGDQAVQITSPPAGLTITNPSNTAVQITSFLFSGATPHDFTVLGVPLPFTLNPNSAVLLRVFFTPRDVGPRSATLLVIDSTDGVSFPVAMTGNGGSSAPSISFVPSSLAFGNQTVGTVSAPSLLTITNPGTASLQITSLSFGGLSGSDFSFPTSFTPPTPASPLVVPANGGSATVPIQFSPGATGGRSATLLVVDNAGGSPHTVVLSGNGTTGGAASIAVTPNSLTFLNQAVGTTSSALNVTVSNSGTSSAKVTGITFAGTNFGDFSTSAIAPLTVPAGSSISIPVKFTPSATGSRSATLTISDDSGGAAHTVTLTGNPGSNVILSPATLAFPDTNVGSRSAAITVTVTNAGTGSVTIDHLSKLGANASDFVYTVLGTLGSSDFPETLAAGASVNMMVSFQPTVAGLHSVSFFLQDSNGVTLATLPVSGNAVQGGGGGPAVINVSASSISFVDQPVGTTSSPVNITVTNSGGTSAQITGLVFSGPNFNEFSTTSVAPIAIAAGTSVNIPVRFTPGALGPRSATITISDNTGGSSHPVTLSGNGVNTPPGFSVTPSSIAFPAQPVGTMSNAVPVTLANNGATTVQIFNLSLTGNNPTDFLVSGVRTPISVLPGQSIVVNVLFVPQASTPRSATLLISDDTGLPHSVSLTGNSTSGSGFTLNPATLAFADTQVGTLTAPLSTNVSNPGTTAVLITGLNFTGIYASDFAFPAGFIAPSVASPITLAPNGGTSSIPVVFKPTASGARSAALVMTGNAVGSSVVLTGSLSLSGNGLGPAFSISPTSVNFGSQGISIMSAAINLFVRNTGTSTLHITNVFFGGANPGDFQTSTPGPIDVSPNGIATLSITFQPTTGGTRSATLVINDDAGGSPHMVPVTGTGIGAPVFSGSATALDFGSVPLNTFSSSRLFRITNTGFADLTIDFASRFGPSAGEFRYSVFGTLGSSDFPETLAPGASVDVYVIFAPTGSPGPRSATFLFYDNASNSPQWLTVTGSAI